jgi:hypothetical protein
LRVSASGAETEADVSNASAPQTPANVDPVSAPDRRGAARYHYRRQPLVRYLVRPSFHAGRAFLRDLSRHGMALLVTRLVEPGTVLFVQLRGSRRGITCTQLARVVHVTEQSPGRWLVGCELTCPLNDEQLRLNWGDDR